MIGNKSKFRIKINAVYQDIGFITEISKLQTTVDEVDVTRYNSVVKEARPTIRSGGSVSLKINYNRTSNINREIESIFKQNKVSDFQLYISDDIGTTKQFKAFFKSFSIDVPSQDNVNIDVSLVVVSEFDTLYSATGTINFVNTSSSKINLPVGSQAYIVKNGVRHDYRTLNYTTLGANATRSINVVCMIPGSTGNTVSSTTMQTDIGNITCTTNSPIANGGTTYPGTPIATPDPDPTPTGFVAATLQNSYLTGVNYNQTDNTITKTAANGNWNAGAWDSTPIGQGEVSFVVAVPQNTSNETEIMAGLSYKKSELDATSTSFNRLDFCWYFRNSNGRAYVRESTDDGASNSSTSYTGLLYDNTKVYSVRRTGTVITYLIDGTVVYTSTRAATNDDLYFDVALYYTGAKLSNMLIKR